MHTAIPSPRISTIWPRLSRRWRLLRLRQVRYGTRASANILAASQRFGVSAPLIASVLADERTRLDAADHVQDWLLRLSLRLPERLAKSLLSALERGFGRSMDSFSLGRR